MVQTEIRLDGFAELDNALSKLPDRVQKKVLQSSVTGAMRVARKTIKSAAPIAPEQSEASLKYGRLSKNIKVGRAKGKGTTSKAAYVSTGNSFWGYFLEFGTRYIPANPWFSSAFSRSISAVLDELKKRLADGIDKQFKGLQK